METQPITDSQVRDFFALIDSRDADGFANAFASEGQLNSGNAPPTMGREAIRQGAVEFFATINALRHEITGIWRGSDGLFEVICVEATVTYDLKDGRTVSMPCNSTMRMKGGMIHNYRIIIDLAPMFAA